MIMIVIIPCLKGLTHFSLLILVYLHIVVHSIGNAITLLSLFVQGCAVQSFCYLEGQYQRLLQWPLLIFYPYILLTYFLSLYLGSWQIKCVTNSTVCFALINLLRLTVNMSQSPLKCKPWCTWNNPSWFYF